MNINRKRTKPRKVARLTRDSAKCATCPKVGPVMHDARVSAWICPSCVIALDAAAKRRKG